jgi:5-methylcytosine-specific restriction endonuclease McrA
MTRQPLQTGSTKGTYKLGDTHPVIPNRFFKCYQNGKEKWQSKETYEKQVIKRRLNMKRWRANNVTSERARIASLVRARKAGLAEQYDTLPDTHKGIVKGIYEASQRISKCLGVTFHVDHVVPISKGGQHTPDNLQIVPAKWNLQKSNKNNARWA